MQNSEPKENTLSLTKFTLLTEWFWPDESKRQAELMEALQDNIACEELERIILFAETTRGLQNLTNDKVEVICNQKRPTFNSLFRYAYKKDPTRHYVIANNDISFKHFCNFHVEDEVVYPCSRYEINENQLIWIDDFRGQKDFHKRSQDAWFFKGNIIVKGARFHMGQPMCDTRLAWLLHMSGNRLKNIGYKARITHIHRNPNRNYTKDALPTPLMNCSITGENTVSYHPIRRWHKRGLMTILFWKWDVTRSLFSSPPEFYFTLKFYSQKAMGKTKSIFRQLIKKVTLQTPIVRDIIARKCLNDVKKSEDGKLFEFLDLLFSERDNWVFFDIGANNGSSTIRYCSCFRNANAYLFEAHPQIVEEAIKNVKQSRRGKRISIHSFAISNKDGTAQFFVSKIPTKKNWKQNHSDSSSLLEPGEHKTLYPHVVFEDTIEVQTKRLDNLISKGEIPVPHFIHMDIQGAEKLALEGLGKYFEEVEAIWLEVSNCELYKNQVEINEIETIMRENGFKKEIDTVNEVVGDQLWLNTKARYPNA